MHLHAIGIHYKAAPLELLERVSFTHDSLHEALRILKQDASFAEAAILSTCHRVEIYAVTAESPRDAEKRLARFLSEFHRVDEWKLAPHLHAYLDQEVVVHLFSVAAGLESMVLGEPQVLGQVRAAYGEALGCDTAGKILSKLFRAAVRVGKRARTETGISRTPLSISSLAVALAEQVLGSVEGKEVLIVGAGEMSAVAGELLHKRGIHRLTVTSRTHERALHLASSLQGEAIPWKALPEALQCVDVVISSTAAPHPVIQAETIRKAMEGRTHPLLLIDIAVPRDIEPETAEIPNVHLYNMDDLQAVVEKNRKERSQEIPVVEMLLSQEADGFMEWLRTLDAVPTLTALREHAETIRSREIQRAFQRLGPISEREKEIIEQLSCRIVTKLLHQPTVRLKSMKSPKGSLEEAARELFGLERKP